MVYIILVQHGQAKSKEEDPERHLTDVGKEESEKVASFLKKIFKEEIHVIYHSDKVRAKETAEIFAKHLNPSEGLEEDPSLAPLEDPKPWIEKLNKTDKNVVVVGHLPHLSKLASGLLVGDTSKEVVKFRYSGALCLERVYGGWLIKFYLIPETLI